MQSFEDLHSNVGLHDDDLLRNNFNHGPSHGPDDLNRAGKKIDMMPLDLSLDKSTNWNHGVDVQYEGYHLEKIKASDPHEKASWTRVGQRKLPFSNSKLVEIIRKQRHETRQSVESAFNTLTRDQQAVATRLVDTRQLSERNLRAVWSLIWVRKSFEKNYWTRTKETKKIFVILKREPRNIARTGLKSTTRGTTAYRDTEILDLAVPLSVKGKPNLRNHDFDFDSGFDGNNEVHFDDLSRRENDSSHSSSAPVFGNLSADGITNVTGKVGKKGKKSKAPNAERLEPIFDETGNRLDEELQTPSKFSNRFPDHVTGLALNDKNPDGKILVPPLQHFPEHGQKTQPQHHFAPPGQSVPQTANHQPSMKQAAHQLHVAHQSLLYPHFVQQPPIQQANVQQPPIQQPPVQQHNQSDQLLDFAFPTGESGHVHDWQQHKQYPQNCKPQTQAPRGQGPMPYDGNPFQPQSHLNQPGGFDLPPTLLDHDPRFGASERRPRSRSDHGRSLSARRPSREIRPDDPFFLDQVNDWTINDNHSSDESYRDDTWSVPRDRDSRHSFTPSSSPPRSEFAKFPPESLNRTLSYRKERRYSSGREREYDLPPSCERHGILIEPNRGRRHHRRGRFESPPRYIVEPSRRRPMLHPMQRALTDYPAGGAAERLVQLQPRYVEEDWEYELGGRGRRGDGRRREIRYNEDRRDRRGGGRRMSMIV